MMKSDKKVTRKCIVTNQIFPVEELVRFNYKKELNEILLDKEKKLKGRGCYFYPTRTNWELLTRKRGLNKAFRTNVSNETYNKFTADLEELKWLR
ncbi:YlxR family protein [Mycoplasmopsis meleagridis]|uniref:YlxR family protein n=1 Tax=Mycoplasmopsis meleagridis TaxID=29561 RepID=UPI0029624C27|nr:YlxR family protein [Mycoplasmopsis meleagridis]